MGVWGRTFREIGLGQDRVLWVAIAMVFDPEKYLTFTLKRRLNDPTFVVFLACSFFRD